MKLLAFMFGLVLLGGVSQFVPILQPVYVAISTGLLLVAAAGGILQFYNSENVDFREVHREKNRLNLQKINILETRIIELEKELYAQQRRNTPMSGDVELRHVENRIGVECS